MRLIPACLGVALLLQACVIPKPRPDAESREDILEGEAVVVGRVQLDPPFGKKELSIQHTGAIVLGKDNERRQLSKFIILTGDSPWEGGGDPEMKEYDKMLAGDWNTPFYVIFEHGKTVLRTLSYTLSYSTAPSVMTNQGARAFSSDWQRAYMPLNHTLEIRPGDQVVYLGTLKYRRDEFNAFKGYSVSDDLDKELPLIQRRFGKNMKVRKALIQKVK